MQGLATRKSRKRGRAEEVEQKEVDTDNRVESQDFIHSQKKDAKHLLSASRAQRLETRKEYGRIEDDIHEHEQELLDLSTGRMKSTLNRTKRAHEAVSFPAEEVIDGRINSTLGGLQLRSLRATNRINRFTVDQFIDKVAQQFGENESINWFDLGDLLGGFTRTAFTARSFLNGTLETKFSAPEKKQAKKKTDKKGQYDTKEERPEDVKSSGKKKAEEEQTQSDRRIQAMAERLPDAKMNYFHFVINPHSYTDSIENMFDMAFLIKDGSAGLTIDPKTKIPYVQRIEPGNPAAEDTMENMRVKQAIISLNYFQYKEIVEAFDIKDSFLPTRPPHV